MSEVRIERNGLFVGFHRVPVSFWQWLLHRLTRGRFGDDGFRGPPIESIYLTLIGAGGGGSGEYVSHVPLRIEPGQGISVTIGGAP